MTGLGRALAYVVAMNWRAVLVAVRPGGEERRSLVFLAGPVLLVALAQGLHQAKQQ